MWVAKLRLKHDCIIGNRCEKFKVRLQSLDLSEERENGRILTSSIHLITGKSLNIRKFLASLKADGRTVFLEVYGNTFFLIDSARNKPVSQFTHKGMFFVKPVIIDERGHEYWEIASPERAKLAYFISSIRPHMQLLEMTSIKNTKLRDVYFPKLMPQLTELQRRAFELATSSGYYAVPKRTTLRNLAKDFGVSLATYQKHLQKAEAKLIPDVLNLLK